MSGWYIVQNKDKVTPVHNLKTGIYLVEKDGGRVVDQWSKRVVFQK